MALEINLVPDIKNEMIRTLKLRNFIFFLCIIVASVSVAVTFIFGVIVGGQSIAINGKTELLKNLSSKLYSYNDLDKFLTIKDQVGDIGSISDNKKLASRTFNILSAMIPQGGLDEIIISELKMNFTEENPTYTIEAQANAGQAPFIDYNVLDSFKKSMAYMRFDYGNYVDKNGDTIPAYCMIEKDPAGAYFVDSGSGGMYAYWTILAEGCNNFDEEQLAKIYPKTKNENNENAQTGENQENQEVQETQSNETEASATSIETDPEKLEKALGYPTEDYDGVKVVKIWRTPQASWYNPRARDNDPQMTEDGEISNVAHFESECITYALTIKDRAVTKIDDSNNICELVPGETDEDRIMINESSNGRDANEQLVLRFSATIIINPEVYDFNKPHMIAIAPSTRRNVTDSYVQLQTIFGERAKDCQEGDTACKKESDNG